MRPWVVEQTDIPPIALALQEAGGVCIVAQGKVGIALGNGRQVVPLTDDFEVQIRTTELIGPHGLTQVRPDAEVVLNRAGQDALARLCRVDPHSLERALPSWSAGPQMFKGPADSTRPLARWQVGSTASGPVAFGCRLCTARRTGEATTAMRYRSGWQRVCERNEGASETYSFAVTREMFDAMERLWEPVDTEERAAFEAARDEALAARL